MASVIYLDSPAGVGLSYSDTRSDYKTNDTHTAADADVFLRRFFERYPEFLRNELYIAGKDCPEHEATVLQIPEDVSRTCAVSLLSSPVRIWSVCCDCQSACGDQPRRCALSRQHTVLSAGESYGGVYVPMLAQTVLDGNDAGALPRLNLKVHVTFTRLLLRRVSMPSRMQADTFCRHEASGSALSLLPVLSNHLTFELPGDAGLLDRQRGH